MAEENPFPRPQEGKGRHRIGLNGQKRERKKETRRERTEDGTNPGLPVSSGSKESKVT